jgi:peptidoglycan/xylan/chitin deacetylase (PgdA/CDA1 family)
LTVGVFPEGSTYDQLLLEMLDQEGIVYEPIDAESTDKYPVVLLPRSSEKLQSQAAKHCENESDVLVVERIADISLVLSSLRGDVLKQEDRFEPSASQEGEKLTSALRAAFFGHSLPFPRKWYWPAMATMCCVLTHDVDWFSYSPFHWQVLRQSSNPLRLVRLAFDSVRGKDYGWNIPEIVSLEESHGYRSTFLFQTKYEEGDPLLERSVELLRSKKFEVALHGTESSHLSAESLRKEIESLRTRTGEDPRGVRYHILKFDGRHTWEIQSEAGLTYDATFCYNRFFGFRAGICLPYHPFSDAGRMPVLELPTSFMDWTSLHRNQGGSGEADAFQRITEVTEKHHGVMVVNFHNTYLNLSTFPRVLGSYETLLKQAKEKGYWVPTAYECATWWLARSRAAVRPRLDGSEVLCEPSSVDVIVQRENGQQEVVPAKTSPQVGSR